MARLDETQDILLRALDGDRNEQNRLFDRIRDRLTIWVGVHLYSNLRAVVEPEDIVQDALLYSVRHFSEFRSRTKAAFWAWLKKIARNRMRDLADHFSAKKRQPDMPIVPTQTTPGTMSMRREEVRRHLEAIQRLPEDYRDVLMMRITEDLPVAEIASEMGRTPNAVRVLIYRARKVLGGDVNGKL